MEKLYKDKDYCLVDENTKKGMLDSGWSINPPKIKRKPETKKTNVDDNKK